jgi:hypothetical protein
MKKTNSIFLILSILISILFLDGCKKGDQDPFFSFRTRKMRVSGEWTLGSRTDYTTTIFNSGLHQTTVITIDGTSVTESDLYQRANLPDSTIIWKGSLLRGYYEFNKNGNLTQRLEYKFTYKWPQIVNPNTNVTTDSSITRNYSWVKTGTWNFLAGIDGYKNKERIALVFQSVNYLINTDTLQLVTDPNLSTTVTQHYPSYENVVNNYANGEFSEIWVLNELKYKQIIMNRDIDEVFTDAGTGVAGAKQTTTTKGNVQQTLSRIKK